MKRAWIIVVPILLISLLVALRPAEGQDNLQDRVSALETQVAELQELVGQPSANTTPTVGITHTITGTLSLRGDRYGNYPNIIVSGTRCYGTSGYDDIQAGGAVTIRDGNDTTIAVGRLDSGTWSAGECNFPFKITDVPDSEFYSIEVTHRGQVFASKQELESTNWRFDLTLG